MPEANMEQVTSKNRGLKWGVGIAVAVIAMLGLLWLLSLMKPSSVVRVAHENPELQAAAKRAQGELDGFIKELKDPKPGEGFAIKGSFATEMGPEYLWVKNPVFEDGSFRGKLDQQPEVYEKAKKGDEVTVKKSDVFDWLIQEESGERRGAYTEKVLEK